MGFFSFFIHNNSSYFHFSDSKMKIYFYLSLHISINFLYKFLFQAEYAHIKQRSQSKTNYMKQFFALNYLFLIQFNCFDLCIKVKI